MNSLQRGAEQGRGGATAPRCTGQRPLRGAFTRCKGKGGDQVNQSASKPISLRRNFTWTASGFAIYALMQWGVIIALAKIGDPTSVGSFTLATAIATPVLLFTNLQLRALQASDARSDFQFSDYVSLRVATSSIGFLLIVAFALLGGYPTYVAGAVVVVGAAKCIESFSDVLYGLFQRHERFERTAKSLIIRSSASLIAVVAVMVTTGSVLLVCLAIAIAWLLTLVFYDLDRAKRLLSSHENLNRYATVRDWVPFATTRMMALTKLAFPLGIVMLLISLNLNIPRIVIERELGIRQLGYFGAMAYPVFAGSVAVFALGEAMVPRLSREFIAAPERFVRVWCRLLVMASLIAAIGVVVVATWGSDLLGILYGSVYQEHGTTFTWLIIGAGFSYLGSANCYALTAARRLKIQVPLFAVVTGATLVGAIVLVPRNGLVGAGQAMAISGLIHALLAGAAVVAAISSRRKSISSNPVHGELPLGSHESLTMESLYEV
jgi:O-antigen/teichoic acid export membrane protein